MKTNEKRIFFAGCLLVILFVIWTWLVQTIDVQSVGVNGTNIGFATFNCWFHKLTGVHMTLYTITDWLGLIPLFVCIMFGGLGVVQLIKRRSLLKVDLDVTFLGIYYVIVIIGYLIFEMFPVNYRPILIQGVMEASYPSSTTLLVLGVIPTLREQTNRRVENVVVKRSVSVLAMCFSVFMVMGRLISGVHWFTDIVGAIILSEGMFLIYKASILSICEEER